jgi:hypothetical protein
VLATRETSRDRAARRRAIAVMLGGRAIGGAT